MAIKKSRRGQKLYKMVGCSTKTKTRKNYLGGSTLAYTGEKMPTPSNPFLAYTGKGGSGTNINAKNPAIPNTGPVPTGNVIFNSAAQQSGGCGCPLMKGGCGCSIMKGGSCSICSAGVMVAGGGIKHRDQCKCSDCKDKRQNSNSMKGGGPGFIGNPWTPNVKSWPGVDGKSNDGNYYPINTYTNDVSRQMIDLGANPPFTNMGGGKKRRKQRGGTSSNLFSQDLINLGRQFQFGIGSAYNALAGYQAPVNPLPWKDQLTHNSKVK